MRVLGALLRRGLSPCRARRWSDTWQLLTATAATLTASLWPGVVATAESQRERGPSHPQLAGVFATVLTPFLPNLQVDEQALKEEILYLLKNQVHGLLLLGSLGEGPYLGDDQREAVLRVARNVAGERVPIVVGITAPSTPQAVGQAQQAKHFGATALTVALPVYYEVSWDDLRQHLLTVARSSGLPVLFYYYPEAYHQSLSPQQVAELLAEPEIIGVKESILDLRHVHRQIELVGTEKKVFWSGAELAMPEFVQLGAQGTASALALVMPRTVAALYEAAKRNDRGQIEHLRSKLFVAAPLLRRDAPPSWMAHLGFVGALRARMVLSLGNESIHARLKAALRHRGLPISPVVSPPLPQLSAQEERLVETVMRRVLALEPTEASWPSRAQKLP
jgi:dihydrodipicolinate synthase/N-acetylneuraminate lyase